MTSNTKSRLDLEMRTGPDGAPVLHFPFMSMSDIHWGTDACKAKRICSWFESVQSDVFMLPGDIVDGEALLEKTQWHFGGPWHRQGIAHVLRKAGQGTAVTTAIGNHEVGIRETTIHHNGRDVPYRQMTGKTLYNVKFVERTSHTDPRGRKILIVHGDKYDDHVFKSSKSRDEWYKRGDKAYTALYNFDTRLQKIPLLEEFSTAALGKKIIKGFLNKAMGINREIARVIDSMDGIDGVLYGHSHMGGFMRSPGEKILMNDGCSTEHVQAMVHDRHGNWALLTIRRNGLNICMEDGHEYWVKWDALGLAENFNRSPNVIEDEYTKKTDRLLRLVYRMWPPRERHGMIHEMRQRQDAATAFGRAINNNPVRQGIDSAEFRKLPIPRRSPDDNLVLARKHG